MIQNLVSQNENDTKNEADSRTTMMNIIQCHRPVCFQGRQYLKELFVNRNPFKTYVITARTCLLTEMQKGHGRICKYMDEEARQEIRSRFPTTDILEWDEEWDDVWELWTEYNSKLEADIGSYACCTHLHELRDQEHLGTDRVSLYP